MSDFLAQHVLRLRALVLLLSAPREDTNMTQHAAILHWHRDRVTVLCPRGHVVTSISTRGPMFAGSRDEAELSSYAAGQPNYLDRLATACANQDARGDTP